MDELLQKLHLHKRNKKLGDHVINDDAGIFKISDELALVQTVDFITPVVNDPYVFGQIAAANSLSDVFAMGGTVQTALNLVSYDNCNLTKEVLTEILKGGINKIEEAGGILIGGHSVKDIEMKYGLAVTGFIHPNKIIRNNTLQSGDKIILTKPLGFGILSTALKADRAPKSAISKIGFFMSYLNKKASEVAVQFNANAMTDVTGFGLIGHLSEMTDDKHSVILNTDNIPIIEEAEELAPSGIFPGGSYSNREFYSNKLEFQNKNISNEKLMLLYDAQTSGGLLISVDKKHSKKFLDELKLAGMDWCKIIGEVTDEKGGKIILT